MTAVKEGNEKSPEGKVLNACKGLPQLAPGFLDKLLPYIREAIPASELGCLLRPHVRPHICLPVPAMRPHSSPMSQTPPDPPGFN